LAVEGGKQAKIYRPQTDAGKGVTSPSRFPPPISDFSFLIESKIDNPKWWGSGAGARIPLLPRNCRSYESRIKSHCRMKRFNVQQFNSSRNSTLNIGPLNL
jgi:hypothetical protein